MKILHTSDWHLGISLHNMSLYDEQKNFMENLKKIIVEKKIDLVIVAGDIFDTSVSASDAIEMYNDIATYICKTIKIPMVVIAGNHDGAARLSSMRELLSESGLYVYGKLKKEITQLKFGNAQIFPIPYFNIDEVRAFYPDEKINSYKNAYMKICDNLREKIDKSMINIVISHSFVSGAELSDSDHSAMVGTASMVSKSVFEGFDYVALGHLHKAQNVSDNIRYSGTPIKYSFSEAKGKKSVTIFDTKQKSKEIVELTPIHDMIVLKGEYDELIQNAKESDSYVKIQLTDRFQSIDVLDTFRSFYPNLLQVVGKNPSGLDEKMTLTVDEVQTLSPTEIINKFFGETFDITPDKKQVDMFLKAMDNASMGGDRE